MRRNLRGFAARPAPSVPESIAAVVAAIAALYPLERHWGADNGVDVEAKTWTDRLLGDVMAAPADFPGYGAYWGEGRNALEFDGEGTTALEQTSSTLAGLFAGTAKGTIVTLAEPTTWDGSSPGCILHIGLAATTCFDVGVNATGGGTYCRRQPAGTLTLSTAQGQRIRTGAYDSTTQRLYHDETLTTTVAAGSMLAPNRLVFGASYIGGGGSLVNRFSGLVRHIIVIPGVCLPTEQPALWTRLCAALSREMTALRIVGSRGQAMGALSSTSITRSESRIRSWTRGGATDICLAFGNYYMGFPAVPPNDYPIRAAIEYNGVNYPVTFRGASSKTVTARDKIIVSDVVAGLTLPAGAEFYVRCGAECALGDQVPTGYPLRTNPATAAHDQMVSTNGGASQVGGTGAMSETGDYTAAQAFGALAVLGVPLSTEPRCLIIGDSIVRTRDDGGVDGNMGWFQRALYAANKVPYTSHDRSGIQSTNHTPANNPYLYILAQWVQSKALVCLGRNSMSNVTNLTTDTVNIIAALRVAGCAVYWALVPPRSTSTDAWATVANQTTDSTEANRQTYHASLQSYVGTTLADVLDMLSLYESGTPGKWIPGTTADGIHPGLAGTSDTVHAQMAAVVQPIAEGW